MNQILVTEKLYITPELKRKKKIYKFHFFLSILLICVLISIYLISIYNMNKSEAISRELLAVATEEEDTTVVDEDVLVVYLDTDSQGETVAATTTEETTSTENTLSETVTTSDGTTYTRVAIINIPKINVNYAVLSETTDELLKISPCKFWGPEPNEVGNFCIVGHNYRNSKFFSKVPTLEVGDTIELSDLSGRTLTYEVYDKYTVDPTDTSCTSQLTNGKKEITLITCTDDSKQRVIVKATCVDE